MTRRVGSSFYSSVSRGSLLPWRNPRRAVLPVTPGALFSIALTNTSTDTLGVYAQQSSAIGFTISNSGTATSQKWQSSTNGVTLAGDIAGATLATFTPNIGTNITDGHFIRAAVIVSGTEYYSVWRQVRQAPGAFAALVNQSFTDDTGDQTYTYAAATGTGLTWAYAPTGLFTGVTHNAGTRTFTYATGTLAVQSGTVLGVTATDQYGRAAVGSPRTYTLTITVNSAVNPDFTNLVFADPGNATPDTLTATYTYGGADTLRAFVAIRNGGSALTAAQLRDGTGTFLERVVVNPFSAATFDLTGFTATSNAGTAVDMAIGEVTNGGLSGVQTTAVSGLDFTAPTLSSAVPADNATGVAVGASPALTFSENIFAGTGSFTLRNVTDSLDTETFNIATGIGSAGGTISIAGAVVTINPFADLAGSKSYAVRWPAGALLDADGNALAANTGDTLYNFTTAAAFDPQSLFPGRDGFSIIPSITTSFESADTSDPAEIGDGVQFQTDSSGLGTPRNLAQSTLTRRPALVTSGSAQALDFEYADSRRIPSVAAFQAQSATNGVTLFARINLESISTGEPDQAIIGADDGSGTNNLFSLRVTSGGLLRMFGYTNNAGSFISATGTTVLSAGVWYNVCGVFNPTNIRVWVNTMTDAGVEGTTTNSAGTVNAGTQNVVLGNLTNSSGGPIMDGLIGYALCINASLNETDRANLAAFATARGL